MAFSGDGPVWEPAAEHKASVSRPYPQVPCLEMLFNKAGCPRRRSVRVFWTLVDQGEDILTLCSFCQSPTQ